MTTDVSALSGQLSPNQAHARSVVSKLFEARLACAKLRSTEDALPALEAFATTLRELYDASFVAIAGADCHPGIEVAVPKDALDGNWAVVLRQLARASNLSHPVPISTKSLSQIASHEEPKAGLLVPLLLPNQPSPGALLLGFGEEKQLTEDERLAFQIVSQDLAAALGRRSFEDESFPASLDASGLLRKKEDLLSLVAHELRTPLTPMALLLQSLETKARRGAIDLDAIARARRQVGRLTKMIGDLLDISRVNAQSLDFAFERLELGNLVREAIEAFRNTSPKHEIELAFTTAKVFVNADEQRLKQALLNLLENAAEGLPNSDALRIEAHLTPSRVMLSITHRRIGIPNGQHRRALPGCDLQRFGLGLHLAEAIAHKHGGFIDVQSELGEGGRLTLTLPLAEPSLANLDSKAAPRLLLVDDDRDILEIIGDILEAEGYDVARAENGAEALRQIEIALPDLVLLDLMMPVVDGWDVLGRLRNGERRCEVPVLVLSAHNAIAEHAKRLHADAYLGKPFEIDALIRKIGELLSKALPARSLRDNYLPAG